MIRSFTAYSAFLSKEEAPYPYDLGILAHLSKVKPALALITMYAVIRVHSTF